MLPVWRKGALQERLPGKNGKRRTETVGEVAPGSMASKTSREKSAGAAKPSDGKAAKAAELLTGKDLPGKGERGRVTRTGEVNPGKSMSPQPGLNDEAAAVPQEAKEDAAAGTLPVKAAGGTDSGDTEQNDVPTAG